MLFAFPRSLIAGLLFSALAWPLCEASAKPRTTPVPILAPPPPMPQTVQVHRGRRAEILLRIFGQQNEALTFIVRNAPQHGKLGAPKVVARETSSVVYEPPADLGIAADRFTFAVKNSRGVSAAETITIEILDDPPILEFPELVQFSPALTGAKMHASFPLKNVGGGVASGQLVLEGPWQIEGAPEYRLEAGKSATVSLVFQAEKSGTFTGLVHFSSDPEHVLTLRGSAQDGLLAEPARVVLAAAPGQLVRAGKVTLKNQTETAQEVHFTADEKLVPLAPAKLPAGGSTEVEIRAIAGSTESLETTVQITGESFALALPVAAPRLGPVLRAKPEALQFGRLSTAAGDSERTAEILLTNLGGAPAGAAWEIGAPFALDSSAGEIAPGQGRVLRVTFNPQPSGKYHALVKVQGDQQTLEIPVDLEVAEPLSRSAEPTRPDKATNHPDRSALEKPVSASQARAQLLAQASAVPVSAEGPLGAGEKSAPLRPADGPELGSSEITPHPGAPSFSRDWLSDARPPAGVKVHTISRHSAVLEWPAALSPETQFRVEFRFLQNSPEGDLDVVWFPDRDAKIERRGDLYTTPLVGLRPGELWTVRVVPLNAQTGEPEKRLFVVDFRTLPAFSFLPHFGWMHFFVALAAIGGFLTWRTRFRR